MEPGAEQHASHHGYIQLELLKLRFKAAEPSIGGSPGIKMLQALTQRFSVPSPAAYPGAEALPGSLASAIAAFEKDCRRVALFYQSQHQNLWSSIIEAGRQLRAEATYLLTSQHAQHGSDETTTHLSSLRYVLDSIGCRVLALDSLMQQNAAAVTELAMLADGQHEEDQAAQKSYSVAANTALFGDLHVDALILGLSDAYSFIQLMESDAAAAAAALVNGGASAEKWVAPETFKRLTRKFWLKGTDVTRFKLEIIKHLPVLLYKPRQKVTEVDLSELPFFPAPSERDSDSINSVYLDSLPDLPSYHSRLRREDLATAVRLRWYGQRDPESDRQKIYVEKKVHRVGEMNGEGGLKERVTMPQAQVKALLSGDELVLPKASERDAEFLADVQQHIVNHRMAPLLRTSYRRTAFQMESHNRVRVSMDTNLSMISEIPGSVSGHWCLDDADIAALPPSHFVDFPYAVVEVKLQEDPPEWLQELVRSEILLPVPKFSKFLNGTAVIFQDYCQNVPQWFLPDSEDPQRLTPATWEEMVGPSNEAVTDAGSWLLPSNFEPPAPSKPLWPWPFCAKRQQAQQDSNSSTSSGKGKAPATPASDAILSSNAASDDFVSLDVSSYGASGTGSNSVVQTGSQAGTADGQSNQGSAATGRSTPVQPQVFDIEAGVDHKNTNLQLPAAAAAATAPRIAAAAAAAAAAATGGFFKRIVSPSSPKTSPLLPSYSPSPSSAQQLGIAEYKKPSSLPPRAMVRTRVEPKTFFANERTFLQWLQISVLVMFLAMSLLSGSTLLPGAGGGSSIASSGCPKGDTKCTASRLSGALIAPVALVFMAYALYMYKKRTLQILRRESVRYDDQRGPVVLVVILLMVMVISYVISMISVF